MVQRYVPTCRSVPSARQLVSAPRYKRTSSYREIPCKTRRAKFPADLTSPQGQHPIAVWRWLVLPDSILDSRALRDQIRQILQGCEGELADELTSITSNSHVTIEFGLKPLPSDSSFTTSTSNADSRSEERRVGKES